MGAGKLSLWRERRRRDAEANLRPLLHPALFAETRRHDRSENDQYDVCGKGPLKAARLSVLSYRIVGQAFLPAGPMNVGKRERLPYNVPYEQSEIRGQRSAGRKHKYRAWSLELEAR